jgi:hypothetical protein
MKLNLTTIEQTGHAVQDVDLFAGMSNLVNMVLSANHRPTRQRPFTLDTLTNWMSQAVARRTKTWLKI